MFEGARVAVVIPAYNEHERVAGVVATLPAFVDLAIVIDDASVDGTSAAAREAVRRSGLTVVVIRHHHNRGVGAAIVTGYREAVARNSDVVAVMAGDGQMDPGDLADVVGPIVKGGADYVKGERISSGAPMPRVRRVGTQVLGFLTGLAIGQPGLGDSQCGYTAISAEAVRRLPLDSLWPRFGYPNDLLGLLAAHRLTIVEVPVRPVYRGEASGLRPWHVGVMLALILRAAGRRAASDWRMRRAPRDGVGHPNRTGS